MLIRLSILTSPMTGRRMRHRRPCYHRPMDDHGPANRLLVNVLRQEAAQRGMALEDPMTPAQERELALRASRRTGIHHERVLCILEMQQVGNMAPT